MTKTKSGFTIVELLVVVVIIAILAAISVVVYNGVQNRATNNSRTSTVTQYVRALKLYATQNGSYPMVAAVGTATNIACFDGGITCWGGTDQTLSTTLNTELKKVVNSLPSLASSAFVHNNGNGYYIIYWLADTSACPSIGGTTPGSNDTNPGVRQCRVLLPAVS